MILWLDAARRKSQHASRPRRAARCLRVFQRQNRYVWHVTYRPQETLERRSSCEPRERNTRIDVRPSDAAARSKVAPWLRDSYEGGSIGFSRRLVSPPLDASLNARRCASRRDPDAARPRSLFGTSLNVRHPASSLQGGGFQCKTMTRPEGPWRALHAWTVLQEVAQHRDVACDSRFVLVSRVRFKPDLDFVDSSQQRRLSNRLSIVLASTLVSTSLKHQRILHRGPSAGAGRDRARRSGARGCGYDIERPRVRVRPVPSLTQSDERKQYPRVGERPSLVKTPTRAMEFESRRRAGPVLSRRARAARRGVDPRHRHQ